MNLCGPSYVAALLVGDLDLIESFEKAFEPAELLEAIRPTILVLARRVAVDSARTLAEVAESLVGAAKILDGP